MVTTGEAFLHHVPTDGASYRMPLAGIVLAWYNGHAPSWLRAVAAPLLWAGPVVLAFELGCLLQGPGGGALAAVLAALPWSPSETGMGEELVYKLLVGLVVLLLAWRASWPSWKRSAVLGLGIGVSLLCRSPLFLLPPLLAAYDLLRRDPERSRRDRLLGAAALLLASYILLTPWVLMNLRLHGRFIPLEDGRADSDVATAAMGLAPNLSGNYRWLAGIPDDDRVLPWAARHVLRHPAPYLGGCLGTAALRHPLAAAAVGRGPDILRPRLPPRGLPAGLPVLRLFRGSALPAVHREEIPAAALGHPDLPERGRGLGLLAGHAAAPRAAAQPWAGWPGPTWPQPAPRAWPRSSASPPIPAGPCRPCRSRSRRPCAATPPTPGCCISTAGISCAGAGPRPRCPAPAGPWSSRRTNITMLFTYAWALAASGQAPQVWLDRVTVGLDPQLPQYADKDCSGYLLEALWHLQAGRSARPRRPTLWPCPGGGPSRPACSLGSAARRSGGADAAAHRRRAGPPRYPPAGPDRGSARGLAGARARGSGPAHPRRLVADAAQAPGGAARREDGRQAPQLGHCRPTREPRPGGSRNRKITGGALRLLDRLARSEP